MFPNIDSKPMPDLRIDDLEAVSIDLFEQAPDRGESLLVAVMRDRDAAGPVDADFDREAGERMVKFDRLPSRFDLSVALEAIGNARNSSRSILG